MRSIRRWLAYHLRPRCTGDKRCKAHPEMGAHMGYTYDSWRDYPLNEERL